jgi:hypothetical protein
MSAYQTANSVYNYNQVFHKKTLDKWINLAHKYNCSQNGWKHYPLKKGSFGYDCMAYCIGYILDNITREYSLAELAELIHEAWSEIYIFWRDNKPWLNNKSYTKSAKPLGDKVRNELAEMAYSMKPIEEKQKDLIIAKFIQQTLFDKLSIYSE